MKPDKPTVELNKNEPTPPGQEVEFALVLSRMIDSVKADPAQLRTAVYEFARSKLNDELAWADEAEKERIRQSLETAIRGVEDFSVRRDEKDRLLGGAAAPPQVTALGANSGSAASAAPSEPSSGPSLGSSLEAALEPASVPVAGTSTVQAKSIGPDLEVLPPIRMSDTSDWPRAGSRQRQRPSNGFLSPGARFTIGFLIVAAFAAGFAYSLRHNFFQTPTSPVVAKPPVTNPVVEAQPVEVPKPQAAPAVQKPPFPLPTVYGVYAIVGDDLKEMDVSFEPIPDKRIGVSSPINKPSRLTLPDGHVRFLVYRRDIANTAPERVDVRVVATVKRAMVFDSNGRGHYVPVNNEWSMRNVSYELRVKPVPQNQEMLLIEPENPDFKLAPGRYALVLKNQGYDFTIAGKANDPIQCLERTDAVNGSFFSDCQ